MGFLQLDIWSLSFCLGRRRYKFSTFSRYHITRHFASKFPSPAGFRTYGFLGSSLRSEEALLLRSLLGCSGNAPRSLWTDPRGWNPCSAYFFTPLFDTFLPKPSTEWLESSPHFFIPSNRNGAPPLPHQECHRSPPRQPLPVEEFFVASGAWACMLVSICWPRPWPRPGREEGLR